MRPQRLVRTLAERGHVHRWARRLLGLGLLLSWAPAAHAKEGQWPPRLLPSISERMQAAGSKMKPEDLWQLDDQGVMKGLLGAVVKVGGCSGAFVSKDGLIATNHHCAFSALQSQSAASGGEHDYLRDGFIAHQRDQEIEATQLTAKILRKVTDVTTQMHAAGASAKTDEARADLVRDRSRALVAACEAAQAHRYCRVARFDHGARYELHEWHELEDLRIVFAPPRSVGEFGGEIDNWMWPRHSGDFTLLRAYAGDKPYQPARFLKPSTAGLGEGDFVAVLGYPGRTSRYLWGDELARHVEQLLPRTVDAYGAWMAAFEALGADDATVKIKVASQLKGLANRQKNARGKLAGLKQMRLLDRRRAEDKALAAWLAKQDAVDKGLLASLADISRQRRARFEAHFLLRSIGRISTALANAVDLARHHREQSKPDAQRAPGYMRRDEKRLRRRLEARLRNFDINVEVELLSDWVMRGLDLPKGQGISGLKFFAKSKRRAKGDKVKLKRLVTSELRRVIAASKMGDREFVLGIFDGEGAQVAKGPIDPLVKFAKALVRQIEAAEQSDKALRGRMLELGPAYFRAIRAVRGGDYYPDANATMRVSFANLRAYDKWDGERQSVQTKVSGMLAKHKKAAGKPPFDLPEAVRTAAESRTKAGEARRFVDKTLGDVPLCFLSDADTTGGNSGSPVIDAEGRWVGLNFDRVWENVAGDYGYADSHSRNVSVDVRYLYWVLDSVYSARSILDELGISPAEATQPSPALTKKPSGPAKTGCQAAGTSSRAWWSLLGL